MGRFLTNPCPGKVPARNGDEHLGGKKQPCFAQREKNQLQNSKERGTNKLLWVSERWGTAVHCDIVEERAAT